MNKLYDIFMNEKKRNPDMTIFYKDNNGQKYLSYSNNEGTLTVKFGEKGKEDFFFKEAGEKGLGEKVFHLEPKNKSNTERMGIVEKKMWDIPARFIQLTDDWQFERDKIGVDKEAKRVKQIER